MKKDNATKELESIKQKYSECYEDDTMPIYTYQGKLGVLYDGDFLTLEELIAKDDIDYELITTSDDDPSHSMDDGWEIVHVDMQNPDRTKELVKSWVHPVFAASDEYVRQLLITTNSEYAWQSERSVIVARLKELMHGYDEKIEKLMKELKDSIQVMNEEWDETCSHYENAASWDVYSAPDFQYVIDEVLKKDTFCDSVKTVAQKVADELNEE
jgi:hypothetical protein